MPKWVAICISLLFGYLLSGKILAQTTNRYFHNFSPEDGLPQSSISAIAQDHPGFMWFGTEDGLARYDGYLFHVYRNDIADPTTLSNNFINALMVAHDGRIWVGTRNGLSIYHPRSDQFISFFHAENDTTTLNSSFINSIFQDSKGDIFIGTTSGLNKVVLLNDDELIFHRYRASIHPGQKEIFEGTVHEITEDQWGRIWFVSQGKDPETREDNGALTCYNSTTESFTHFYSNSTAYGLSSDAVRSVYTAGNNLWVGTIDGGLNKFTITDNCSITGIQVFQSGENEAGLPHNYVSKIIKDTDSNIWIGTYEGLISANHNTTRFYNNNEFGQLASSTPPIIRDLLSDKAGNLWVATDRGLYVYFPSRRKFELFTHDPNDTNSLAAGDIFGITEDSNGDIWSVSYGTGLNRIVAGSSENPSIFRYTSNGENPVLPTAQLLGITEDSSRNLWVSSFDGLIKITKPSNNDGIILTHFPPEQLMAEGEPRKYHTRIFKHPSGSLWVRTYQNGIDIIENPNQELKVTNLLTIPFKSDTYRIRSFFMDETGMLWIATDSKLFRGDIDQNGRLDVIPVSLTTVSWERLMELNINYILGSGNRYAWIGTSNGLAKLTFQYNTEDLPSDSIVSDIKIYTENDGLPNNTVYAIASDDNQNLWLSTNKGLSKFSIHEETFANYLLEGGATVNEFNEGAVEKGKNGHIYFGGIGGLVRFHPDSILQNPFIPPVVITDIHVLNEDLPAGDARLTFSDTGNIIEEITLPYTDDFFTIHFSALNFNQPENNEYAYMLHGFHDEWIYSGDQRQATFTNLDDGEYLFQVIGSNNDGVWNEAGASLRIIILPPFWETWYAYAFYLLVFLMAGYLFIRQRVRAATKEMEIQAQIERAKHEERERFRKKTSQDFHDEAGNKITKINLFTELAKAEAGSSKELSDFLRKIEINTRELSAGMRDFIWTMDPEKDTLFDTLMRLKDFGNSMFQGSGIGFEIKGLSSQYHSIKLPMDTRRTILQIFKEAMNNCAKYANATQLILKISVNHKCVRLSLEDDGVGFNPTDIIHQKGYGTKIMKERAKKIEGKLTIHSKTGAGTNVELQFNLPHIGDVE